VYPLVEEWLAHPVESDREGQVARHRTQFIDDLSDQLIGHPLTLARQIRVLAKRAGGVAQSQGFDMHAKRIVAITRRAQPIDVGIDLREDETLPFGKIPSQVLPGRLISLVRPAII